MDHDSCRALFAEKFLKMLSQEIAHRVRIIGLPRSPSDGAVWTVECLAGGSELALMTVIAVRIMKMVSLHPDLVAVVMIPVHNAWKLRAAAIVP